MCPTSGSGATSGVASGAAAYGSVVASRVCYGGVGALKRRLGLTSTSWDGLLLELLEQVSWVVEMRTGRVWHPVKEARYFPRTEEEGRKAQMTGVVWLDDCLGVDAVGADAELDGTHDGEAWTEGTDYRLEPRGSWPKWKLRVIAAAHGGRYVMRPWREYLKITGTWGYGSGAWVAPGGDAVAAAFAGVKTEAGAAVTGTLADASTLELTLSAAAGGDGVEAGELLQVGSEWVAVESASGVDVVLQGRGMFGSTAAAADGAAVGRYRVPAGLARAVLQLAADEWVVRKDGPITQEMNGTYMRILLQPEKAASRTIAALSGLVRYG